MKISIKWHEEDNIYVGEIPELNVATQGETKEEILFNLKEAAECSIYGQLDRFSEKFLQEDKK